MKKDWARSAGEGKKMTVSFTNTVIVVRTEMMGDDVRGKPTPIEFKVAFTKDGLKIVAMK